MNNFIVGQQVFLRTGVTDRYLKVTIVSIDESEAIIWAVLKSENGEAMAEFGSAIADVLVEMPLNGKILSEED